MFMQPNETSGLSEIFANKILKLSGLGWSYNERLLTVHNGILSYYSKPNISFTSDGRPILPKEEPKMSIKLDDAKTTLISEKDKEQYKNLYLERCFKIIFSENAVIGEKQSKKPKDIIWYFQAFSTDERDKWVLVLTNVTNEIQGKKAANQIQVNVSSSNQKVDEKANSPFENQKLEILTDPLVFPTAPVHEKSKSEDVTEPNVIQEQQKFSKTEDNANKLQEQLKLIHEEIEKLDNSRPESEDLHDDEVEGQMGGEELITYKKIQEMEKYKKYLEERKAKGDIKAWDLKFQKYWGELIDADRNLEQSMVYCERLVDHVGKFRRTANFYVRLIVDELHKPIEKRRFRPLHEITQVINLLCDDDPSPIVYLINGILFKFSTKDSALIRKSETGEYIENKWKAYGREFQAYDILFDALFVLSKPQADYNLRVPLSCLIDYKGFRILAIGYTPLNEVLDPVLGLSVDGTYREAILEGVTKQIPHIAEVLNIKDHNFVFYKATQPTHVWISPLVEVHRRDNTQTIMKDDADMLKIKKESLDWDIHIPEFDYDKDVYYILKSSEIFPVDYTPKEEQNSNAHLRPEFVCRFEKALRSDLLKKRIKLLSEAASPEDYESGFKDLCYAKQDLMTKTIMKLVEELDSLNIVPVDSITLTEAFHKSGVNMRYLGLVAEQSILTHVKECCVVEMLARTLKNILNEVLADKILTFSHEPDQKSLRKKSRAKYLNLARSIKEYGKSQLEDTLIPEEFKKDYEKSLEKSIHGYTLELIYDFINLVFGKDHEGAEFWQKFLIPRASHDFGYAPEKFLKLKVSLNALLFSFAFHFGLEIDYSRIDDIGKNVRPFSNQIVGIIGRVKTYKLRNVPISVLAGRYKEYKMTGRKELALKSLKTKIAITKILESRIDTTAISEIAELLLEEGLADKAIEQALYGLKNVPSNHTEAIKFDFVLIRGYYEKDDTAMADKYCTDAISSLQYHWGPYHPLHSTIYTVMAFLIVKYKEKYEQALQLYQASLICCARVLGPNHSHTAEVYMDFARLYLKMNNKEQALSNIEKAYLIYESSMERNISQLASAAFQLATIMEEQRRYKDALPYARKAAELYGLNKGQDNEMCITSSWIVVCISFQLMYDDMVQEHCRKILDGIELRENRKKQRDESLDDKIDKIKQNCIAAVILVITRNLPREEKRCLLKLAEDIYSEWHEEEYIEKDTATPTDILNGEASKLMTLTNLEFDEARREFLERFYLEAKSHEGIFQYYKGLVSNLYNLCECSSDSMSSIDNKDIKDSNDPRVQMLNEYFYIK